MNLISTPIPTDAKTASHIEVGACGRNTAGRAGVDNTFLKTDSLFTTDLVTSYTLTQTVGLYLRVENVFDEREITHRGDGARGNPGRWTSVGANLRF